jgi:hypothetical protein
MSLRALWREAKGLAGDLAANVGMMLVALLIALALWLWLAL